MKAFFQDKKRLRLIIAFCVLTLLAVVSFAVFDKLGHVLYSQQAAERFRGETEVTKKPFFETLLQESLFAKAKEDEDGKNARPGTAETETAPQNPGLFAQVSVFFPVGGEITEDSIYSFRSALEAKYADVSLEAPETGSLYKDAYCAMGTVTVSSEKATATVSAIGVGGDFFQFHPLYLRSGSYIAGSDLVHDAIVVDEELAWRLFGGVDLAGMMVKIGDEPYIIAGVVAREDDFASRSAYTQGAGLYMAYDRLNALSEKKISVYEIVAADPIDSFVKSQAETSFSGAVTVENSSRFSVFGIFDVIKSFGKRSMNTAGVVFPYWENAARYVEDIMSVVLLFGVLCAVFPLAAAIVFVVKSVKGGTRRLKEAAPELLDRYSEWRYERIQEKKHAVGGDK